MTAPLALISVSRRQAGHADPKASCAASASGRLPVGDHDVADVGVLRLTPTSSPPGLAITGEIDESTYGDLVGALKRLAAGPGEIHVDLAGVEYCDLVGLRAIVDLTGADGQDHSRRVVLQNIPPRLRAVLGILGWDCTPGLIIDGQGTSAKEPTASAHDGHQNLGAQPL